MEFSGKTVLVTGASGIGRAVSLAFGRAGANVFLSYITSAREAAEVTDAIGVAGGQGLSRSADLTDAAAVDALFAAGRSRFGRVDTPEDVAETVVFLASPRASFLTGETIQINDGLEMF